jgi:hypothetical protein
MPTPEYSERRYYGPGSSPYQVVTDGCKLCSKCGESKPLEAFHPAKRASGRSAECRVCRRAMPSQHGEARRQVSREWYRRSGMDRIRTRLYGLSPEQYAELLAQQMGICAICGQPETREYRGHPMVLAVDHCHDTDEVRGLLCGKCNVAIGMLNHDIGLLDKARAYLER